MLRPMFACLFLLTAAVAMAPAHADTVRRCVDAQGVAVYTDRPCESVQAVPRGVDPAAASGAYLAEGFSVRGCARRPEQLLDGVRGALEAHDVNRLANWYHWTGTGTGTARHLMDELEAISRRSVVAIELLYPGGPPSGPGMPFPSGETATGPGISPPPAYTGRSVAPASNAVGFTSAAVPSAGREAAEANPAPLPSPATAGPAGDAGTLAQAAQISADAAPEPDGLHIQQTRSADDIAAVSTRFRLVRNAGCWWIEL